MRSAVTWASRSGAGRAAGAIGAIALVFTLGGCGFNVREDLGLISKGPDEFAVVKKKPLQMPSDTASLPEPRPGAASLVDPRPTEDAQAALTGKRTAISSSAEPSRAENALLSAARVDQADPAIRKKLAEEDRSGEARLLDGFLGKGDPDTDPLDAEKEAERLAEQARKGKNPNLERRSEQSE